MGEIIRKERGTVTWYVKSIRTPAQSYKDADSGTVSGYFSTFESPENPDSYGDICKRGCFLESIKERKASGHPFPLCYNHDMDQVIGVVTDIGEDTKGGYFTAEFFNTEHAQEIRKIVSSGAVWQCSFAYDVIESGKVRNSKGQMVNELRKLKLHEVSIVVVPANSNAVITNIKKDPEVAKKQMLEAIERIEKEKQAGLKVPVYFNIRGEGTSTREITI